MKNLYGVVAVDMAKLETPDDYINAYREAEPVILNGLQEVFNYCGGKLYRGRCGYGGMNNGISYYAYKIDKA